MRRLVPWALSGLLAASSGCHRGGHWEPVETPAASHAASAGSSVELLVFGQARASRATTAVAQELERTLDAADAAGRPAVVAWLGTDFGRAGPDRSTPCPTADRAYSPAPLHELAQVLARAHARGTSVWGLPGPDGLRCGLGTGPYRQPGLTYVLRVHSDGGLALASSCAAQTCTLLDADPAREVLVELVVAELSPWHYRGLLDDAAEQRLHAEQRSLLDALAAAPAAPRILLSSIPLDSGGAHGLGGRLQRSGFRYLPAHFRTAIAAGMFVGTIGALERSLQISADQSNAIHRSQRVLITAPVFGVVSGAGGGASHTPPTSRGDALFADLEAEAPGFVRLLISPERVYIEARARSGGRWRAAGIELPLAPEPHAPFHESPIIQPCTGCDPLGAAADGETFVPRPPRPR